MNLVAHLWTSARTYRIAGAVAGVVVLVHTTGILRVKGRLIQFDTEDDIALANAFGRIPKLGYRLSTNLDVFAWQQGMADLKFN